MSKSLYTILKKVSYLMPMGISLQSQAKKEFLHSFYKKIESHEGMKVIVYTDDGYNFTFNPAQLLD